MRNERPTVTILNTTPFKKLQHSIHKFLRRIWSREVRCIGREFARHILKTLHVLRIVGIYNLSDRL